LALLTVWSEPQTPEKFMIAILPATLLVIVSQASSMGRCRRGERQLADQVEVAGARGHRLGARRAGRAGQPGERAAVHRNMFMVGRAPSAGVAMLALLREPTFARGLRVRAAAGHSRRPPRPKLSSWPLAVTSVKPES